MQRTIKLMTPYGDVKKCATFDKAIATQAYMTGLFAALAPFCDWWRPVHADVSAIEFSNGFRITCTGNIFAVMDFELGRKKRMVEMIPRQIATADRLDWIQEQNRV